MRTSAVLAAALALAALSACNSDSGVGYVEIRLVPASVAPAALYLDTVKLEPPRNGMALLRQKVGTARLQVDAEGGQPALLCSIVVQKNRITSVTVSVVSRQLRCQCTRSGGGKDPPSHRTCVA